LSTKLDENVTKYIQFPWEQGYERQNQDSRDIDTLSNSNFTRRDSYHPTSTPETSIEGTTSSVIIVCLADSKVEEQSLVEHLLSHSN
jgi:hypothetical protein